MDRAEIYCLCFNSTSTFLACSRYSFSLSLLKVLSDKGTIHIFSLANETPLDPNTIGAAMASSPAQPGLASSGKVQIFRHMSYTL